MSSKDIIKQKKETKRIVQELDSENRYFEISTDYEKWFSPKDVANFESMMETGKKFNNLDFKIRDFFVYSGFKRKKYKLQKGGINFLKRVGRILAASFCITLIRANMPRVVDGELKTAAMLVQEYDAGLEEYASQFNTDTMSTMEIVMAVMNDIRSNTYYGIPKNEILIYPRLSLDGTKNIGTCRNMADKFTTIMNLIDPRFQAKNFAVTLDTECTTFTFCDIQRPIEPEFLKKYESGNSLLNILDKIPDAFFDVFGNHLVTVLKPIEDDCYLVIDVTNPSIGIFTDGKVYTLNAEQYDFVDYRPVSQLFTSMNTFDDINRWLLLSRFQDVDLTEANAKYGIEAQNKTLEKIKD